MCVFLEEEEKGDDETRRARIAIFVKKSFFFFFRRLGSLNQIAYSGRGLRSGKLMYTTAIGDKASYSF